VFDVDHDRDRAQSQGLEPNGFSFDGADAGGVDYALNRLVMYCMMRQHYIMKTLLCQLRKN